MRIEVVWRSPLIFVSDFSCKISALFYFELTFFSKVGLFKSRLESFRCRFSWKKHKHRYFQLITFLSARFRFKRAPGIAL